MVRSLLPASVALLAVLLAGNLAAPPALAAGHATSSDLFYNYYVPPVGYPSVGAAMYPCPRPTPPVVGHTYVTYQPLAPQEFLYQHSRTYRTYNPCAGWTTTNVIWCGSIFNWSCFTHPREPMNAAMCHHGNQW